MLTEIGARTRFRALFLSDIHLGNRECQAERLAEFLRDHDAEVIYLIGDIVDGWQLKAGWHWPQSHNDVLHKLVRKARKGTRIIYIPGSHDKFLRQYCGTQFGGIEVAESAVHIGLTGLRYLVVHGDLFDTVLEGRCPRGLLGDSRYHRGIATTAKFNRMRRLLGRAYGSLSKWAKSNIENAVNLIGEFEHILVAEARRHGVDGIICGHVHHPAMQEIFGVRYINCGDWVESCTAVAEHADGGLEIIKWAAGTDLGEESYAWANRLRVA